MKRVSSIMFLLISAVLISCNNYLDINENPNQATAVGPELVLPQALAATANALDDYNTYGMQIGGYAANAGGYGGFNETVSYKYTPNNYSNLWTSYDNLEDYQYIIDKTEGDPNGIYLNAVAKIMKSYGFQLLVDAYNNIPYTEALKGEKFLTPKYDDGAEIYSKLATNLDEAIALIKTGQGLASAPASINTADIIFGGDMNSWIKFANTIKLRLIVRAQGKATFTDATFTNDGFLTTDALANPGYTKDNNRQNPKWDVWAYAYTGSAGLKSWIPSTFIMGFYNNAKINDPGRGNAVYYQFATGTGTNQLGYEATGIPKCPDGTFWYPANADQSRKDIIDTTGVLKGPSAGYPVMIASESYFLQAEAALRGIIAGDDKALFNKGITASFDYLYQFPDKSKTEDIDALVADYQALNASNALVNYDLATTTAMKTEAIITQKYIALNMVNSHEGWNEYRRTGYPSVSGTAPETTFASKVSQSTRLDKLPSRVLYPTSEVQYNSANVPSATTNSFTSLIFWAK